MYWEEDIPDQLDFTISDDVVDVAFAIECTTLPVDHAYALYLAVRDSLPWFEEEKYAGLHTIFGAQSGNGWYRPDDGVFYLSRRTKLMLRLPKERVEDAQKLSGKKLDVAGSTMKIKGSTCRLLSKTNTLYARYVVDEEEDENSFLARMVGELRRRGYHFRKALCGKQTTLCHPNNEITARSLLVADLSCADAIILQMEGLASHRKMGCGLFVPYKTV